MASSTNAARAAPEAADPSRRWPAPQTRPEDVFLAWLLALPDGADAAEAARREIARLDRAAPLAPGLERLRQLMIELARAG